MGDALSQRRLAAILAADVAGYTRLVEQDTDGTVAAWKAARDNVIKPGVEKKSGRIIKFTGDGFLVEFPSVQDAVACAIYLQEQLVASSLNFRMGVNVGDITDDGGDVHGEGVNIAARLEAVAEPGGICISGDVYNQVRNRIEADFSDLGDKELKNIPVPVRVYRVLMGPGTSNAKPLRFARTLRRRRTALAVPIIFVLLGGLAIWNWWGPITADQIGPGGIVKPSIAVLPFTNLNKDQEDDYFSEGITNDIITDLSKFQNMMVIASNSVSGYKGKTVDVKDVIRELQVRYVLQGSVMKRQGRVRINTQLIDGASGQTLWAQRYDEGISNIWDIKDEITARIVRTLAVRISKIEQQRVLATPSDNFKAYEYVLKGQALLARQSRSENFEARKLFRRAIELDLNYATAYSGLGWTFYEAVQWGWTGSPQKAVQQAYDLSQKALSLQPNDIFGRRLLASIYGLRRQHELALIESERLIAINPNDAGSFAQQGMALTWLGQPDGAILALERSLHFDPDMKTDVFWHLGLAYYLNKRYADSVAVLERNIGRKSNPFWDYLLLAAVYGQMGRQEEAARVANAVRQIDPQYKRLLRFGQFKHVSDTEKVNDGLRKAGLL
jgi:adenylate cyclase